MSKDQTIYLGADHAGFDLKEQVKQYLYSKGCRVHDCGNAEYDESDDYPDFAFPVARSVAQDPDSMGILFCGSGIGMSVAANKVPGIRAVNVCIPGNTQSARSHNDGNVLCLGARSTSFDTAKEVINTWIESPFGNVERHVRRVNKILNIEKGSCAYMSKQSQKRQKIIPAILETSLDEVEKKLQLLLGKTDWIQLDIMDGEFVPEKSFALSEFEGHKWPFLFEAHLMVSDPKNYIHVCEDVGIQRMVVHIEALKENASDLIDRIHEKGMEVGIAINPDTPNNEVTVLASKIDTILVMGVQPGKAGQEFTETTYDKVREIRRDIPWCVKIDVDGGVGPGNMQKLKESGVNHFSVGSAIFASENPVETLRTMKKLL